MKKGTGIERFNFFLPIASADTEGKIEGATLVSFGEVNDRDYRIEIGALDEWLADNPDAKVVMCREHMFDKIIGQWTDLRIEGNYLLADGQLYIGMIAEAAEVRSLIQAGVLLGVSIGFDADWEDISYADRPDGGYGLDFAKIQLKEASLVFNPADENAGVAGVQHDKPAFQQTEDGNMTDLTKEIIASLMDGKISLIQDETDKKLIAAKEAFEQSLETKLSDLDEGIVKQVNEAIEKAKAAATQSSDAEWKQGTVGGRPAHLHKLKLPQRFAQANNYASPTVGGGSTPAMPIHTFAEANFLRRWCRILPITDASGTVPVIGDIAFSEKPTTNRTIVDAGGEVTADDAAVKTWAAKIVISNELPADLPGFRDAMSEAFSMHYMARQLQECLGVAETAAKSSGRQVKTGVAADLPTKANMVEKMYELVDHVNHAYHIEGMTAIIASGYARGRLGAASDGGPYFDPSTRMSMFDAYPIRVTSTGLGRGNKAADLSAIFANWRQALTLFERETLDIAAYEESEPGYITYYAQGRFVPIIANPAAISGLFTAA